MPVVDDIGTVVNPLLAMARSWAASAQGAGQALYEDIVYDGANGQMVTGTLMITDSPRRHDARHRRRFQPGASKSNPLGIKGVGEGGTVAAPRR